MEEYQGPGQLGQGPTLQTKTNSEIKNSLHLFPYPYISTWRKNCFISMMIWIRYWNEMYKINIPDFPFLIRKVVLYYKFHFFSMFWMVLSYNDKAIQRKRRFFVSLPVIFTGFEMFFLCTFVDAITIFVVREVVDRV